MRIKRERERETIVALACCLYSTSSLSYKYHIDISYYTVHGIGYRLQTAAQYESVKQCVVTCYTNIKYHHDIMYNYDTTTIIIVVLLYTTHYTVCSDMIQEVRSTKEVLCL